MSTDARRGESRCPVCEGTGDRWSGSSERPDCEICQVCHGTGKAWVDGPTIEDRIVACPGCSTGVTSS